MAKKLPDRLTVYVDPELLDALRKLNVNVQTLARDALAKAAAQRKCPCCNQELNIKKQFDLLD